MRAVRVPGVRADAIQRRMLRRTDGGKAPKFAAGDAVGPPEGDELIEHLFVGHVPVPDVLFPVLTGGHDVSPGPCSRRVAKPSTCSSRRRCQAISVSWRSTTCSNTATAVGSSRGRSTSNSA